MIMVRLFWPFELATDRFLMIVDVVVVIGMAATAAALVVASTIGINFSVVMCVEFSKMLGIMGFISGFTPRNLRRCKCVRAFVCRVFFLVPDTIRRVVSKMERTAAYK